MMTALRFWWRATRGHRLRPWRSQFLRWRLETYSGQKAETIRARDFISFALRERAQLARFLRWTREMEELKKGVIGAARPPRSQK